MEILVWLLSAILKIIMCFICGTLILFCVGEYEFKNPIGIVIIMSLILILLIAMNYLA